MARKQSKMHFMLESGLLPEYSGKGVYALVDREGKMYIGSSTNCRLRVYQHYLTMENARNNGMTMPCSSALTEAAKRNVQFRWVILEKLDDATTKKQLQQHEQYWIEAQGGLDNTYNMLPATRNIKRDCKGNIVFQDAENENCSTHIPLNKMIVLAISHAGISIEELARRMKKSPNYLLSILTKNKCSLEELKSCCAALNAKLTVRFDFEDGSSIG